MNDKVGFAVSLIGIGAMVGAMKLTCEAGNERYCEEPVERLELGLEPESEKIYHGLTWCERLGDEERAAKLRAELLRRKQE